MNVDALLTSFIAAALAELGDRTQLFVVVLAMRFGRPAPILAGLALAALANSLIAAVGGVLIGGMIDTRALSLLVALALLFAAGGSFIRRSEPRMGEGWRTGAFVTAALCLFLVEFGDKTQFLTFALAGRFDSVALAAAGATAGIVAANIPAVLLGDRLAQTVPVRALRYAIGGLFLIVGFIVAVQALELV